MRRCATLIGWPRCDPRHYRFAVPNAAWEYRLKPVEFVIFSYLCYHRASGTLTPEMIAAGVHMTSATVKKYLTALIVKKLINEDGALALKSKDEKFFTLPNEVFLLRLPPSAFMVYAYLLLIEERQTHTCHPSYNTIAAAASLSKNTAMKSISVLLDMGLITVKPSSYFDKRGMKWKGNNLYTIQPMRLAVDAFHQRQFHQLELDTEHRRVLCQQAEYNRRRPRAALCAPTPAQAALTHPNRANRCMPVERRRARDGREQDKRVASYDAPPFTSARSAGSLRGTRAGSQT